MAIELDEWVRKNKKRIAREFIRRGDFHESDHPTGIITAGLPGAGKTEFTQELLKQMTEQPLRIDMDEIATLIEGYSPEMADKFRTGASSIMSRIYDEVVKHKIDFILDGTFAGSQAVSNVARAMSHGYRIKIYYIYQDPKVAWDFTRAREKVEHRAIEKDGFIDTYYRLHENLVNVSSLKPKLTLSVIMKNEDNKIGIVYEDVENFSQYIPRQLSRIELESVL